jgi:hypothetical protein
LVSFIVYAGSQVQAKQSPPNKRKHMPLARDTFTPPSNRRPLKTNKKQAASTALAVALLLAGHQTVPTWHHNPN